MIESNNLNLTSNEKKVLVELISKHLYALTPVPTEQKPYLPVLTSIKSVIFDIYGTLLVSASGDIGTQQQTDRSIFFCRACTEAGFSIKNNTVCEYGLELFQKRIKFHHRVLIGKGIRYPEIDVLRVWSETLAILLKEGLLSGTPSRMAVVTLAVLFEVFSNPLWIMPGLSEILSFLKERTVMGIISNAQFYTPLMFQALLHNDMENAGFNNNFIFFSYQYKRAKPSPFLFEKMKKQLYTLHHITSNEILYVGNDMLNDIQAASRSGYRTALFAGDKRSLRLREDQVKDVVPHVVLTDLRQLKEVIQ